MTKDGQSNPEMRDEYDFSNGVPGKYARRFTEGSNVVVLDPVWCKKSIDGKRV